jgi:tyrosyl-tRNA synthetase
MFTPFAFFFVLLQTFISIPDSDVLKYLKMLTFVPTEELDQRLLSSTKNPDSKRELQKLLAKEVTLLVHGGKLRTSLSPEKRKRRLIVVLFSFFALKWNLEKGLRQAIQGTEFLFPTESKLESDSRDHWSKEKLDETFENSPNWIELKSPEVIGRSLGDLSVISRLFQSKGQYSPLLSVSLAAP